MRQHNQHPPLSYLNGSVLKVRSATATIYQHIHPTFIGQLTITVNVSRETPMILQTFDMLLISSARLSNPVMFDDRIGGMNHESYLVFCIRIQPPYQNR